MDQIAEIIRMLLGVLLQLLELFVGFLVSALGIVLQFARSIVEMVN